MQFDNVVISPHTASVTNEAHANMGRIAAEQMLVLDAKRTACIGNPEAWPAYAQRIAATFAMQPR